MQRVVLATTRYVRLSRCSSSSSSNAGVGTIQRRKPALARGRALPGSPEAEIEMEGSMIELSTEVHRNNFLLATGCVAFCGAIMWYSMYAVGQSGGQADDPLAALKEEASAAQAIKDKESRNTDEATAMLKQFERGAFDPDQVDDDEESQPSKKKPWWKVW